MFYSMPLWFWGTLVRFLFRRHGALPLISLPLLLLVRGGERAVLDLNYMRTCKESLEMEGRSSRKEKNLVREFKLCDDEVCDELLLGKNLYIGNKKGETKGLRLRGFFFFFAEDVGKNRKGVKFKFFSGKRGMPIKVKDK